ncbi:hypothetical protein [Ancylobacter defluvii]|uniref:Uncharacterized protein n=1 Tax=Ancylobacter defluvii TaxID=1282440 RepID=A0A9W6NBV2_9HYPH|nr:hypothetical protein [Ancylobacter defluvii]MBS7589373.1 hypothetical protein [Ancylobacter defluvii]GLK84987.1 hypothetical protein GCM10017653_30570 [Ancylobacter defluvii]
MSRIFVAIALIASFGLSGVTAASAAGRSKDERAAWWQTMHQSKQPWKDMANKSKAAAGKPTAPAASTAPKAAKPAQ